MVDLLLSRLQRQRRVLAGSQCLPSADHSQLCKDCLSPQTSDLQFISLAVFPGISLCLSASQSGLLRCLSSLPIQECTFYPVVSISLDLTAAFNSQIHISWTEETKIEESHTAAECYYEIKKGSLEPVCWLSG